MVLFFAVTKTKIVRAFGTHHSMLLRCSHMPSTPFPIVCRLSLVTTRHFLHVHAFDLLGSGPNVCSLSPDTVTRVAHRWQQDEQRVPPNGFCILMRPRRRSSHHSSGGKFDCQFGETSNPPLQYPFCHLQHIFPSLRQWLPFGSHIISVNTTALKRRAWSLALEPWRHRW